MYVGVLYSVVWYMYVGVLYCIVWCGTYMWVCCTVQCGVVHTCRCLQVDLCIVVDALNVDVLWMYSILVCMMYGVYRVYDVWCV